MANMCPNVGFFLGFVATVGILYTLASKSWKQNSQVASQSNMYGVHSYEGLWVRCTSPVPGTFQCDTYDTSILGIQTGLTGQRIMMCLATICAVFGLIAGALGLHCIRVMENSRKSKVWTGRGGGFLMLFGGTLCFASVTWYAVDVVRDFWLKNGLESTTFQYEFGAALYVGWVSSGVALIAGALMACCTCGGSDDSDDMGGYKYNYKPPAAGKPAARNTEYV
ncbi:claudin-19-like isoform X1 [Clavelina lepadiformis]|uniref:claudin-19-like isoform X1 n=1 Tax=Clavelina lepadiformis TaxID=159417 RepID=UPI00404360D2